MSRRLQFTFTRSQDTLRALRRAAKNALELGLKTGTPVWVVKNNKLVDLTKEHGSKKSAPKRSSRNTNSINQIASRLRGKYFRREFPDRYSRLR
jgi:hypothetical protein